MISHTYCRIKHRTRIQCAEHNFGAKLATFFALVPWHVYMLPIPVDYSYHYYKNEADTAILGPFSCLNTCVSGPPRTFRKRAKYCVAILGNELTNSQ